MNHRISRRAAALAAFGAVGWRRLAAGEVLPTHVTPETLAAVRKGLDALARMQSTDGSWMSQQDGRHYPAAMAGLAGMAFLAHGNTTTRGKYAGNIQGTVDFLVSCTEPNGLISGPGQDSGMPMHGHGFSLLFLASAFGYAKKGSKRDKLKSAIERAVRLTCEAQSGPGGWTYTPGGGDEGSVAVTQIQALRACHNAGFLVPKSTIERAVKYIEACGEADGGIRYAFNVHSGSRPAISAAAVATLYNAGEFDAPIAERCLKYCVKHFKSTKSFNKDGGHDYYAHLYASQGFYLSGDPYWDVYYPETRDHLLSMQNRGDGAWQGEIGPVYGTAIACIVLQLPFKFLPVFQR